MFVVEKPIRGNHLRVPTASRRNAQLRALACGTGVRTGAVADRNVRPTRTPSPPAERHEGAFPTDSLSPEWHGGAFPTEIQTARSPFPTFSRQRIVGRPRPNR